MNATRTAALAELRRTALAVRAVELTERPRVLLREVERIAPLLSLGMLDDRDMLALIRDCRCGVDLDDVRDALERGAHGPVPVLGEAA